MKPTWRKPAGMGLILSPVSTDALNRAPRGSYGEVTGITQTVRNFGSSLGLALLGTVLINQNRSNLESTAAAAGLPQGQADALAEAISGSGGSGTGAGDAPRQLLQAIPNDFGLTSQTVFQIMAAIMAVAFVVALVFMTRGVAPQVLQAQEEADAADAAQAAGGANAPA